MQKYPHRSILNILLETNVIRKLINYLIIVFKYNVDTPLKHYIFLICCILKHVILDICLL